VTAGRVLLAVCGGLLVWALFFGGGDSTGRLVWIGGATLAAAAVVAALALAGLLARPRLDTFARAFIVCFAAFVLWQGVSIVWSIQPDRSWDYVNRGLVYLGFLALGLFAGALVPRPTRSVANGLAALLGAVLAYALLAKGIPALYADYGRLARLRTPVGYWNALALLGDFALVLGLWRAAQRQIDGVLLVYTATLTILLAYSRGGVVIAVLVVVAWLALDRRRLPSLVALALGGGAGVAVAGISLALHGVSDDLQPHSVRVHDGRLFLVAVVVAGAVVLILGRLVLRLAPPPRVARRAAAVLVAAIAIAAVVGIAAVALHGDSAATASPAGTHCVQGATRFACGSSDERLDWWKEAWQSFEDKPLDGTGAGSFGLSHRLRRAHFTRPVTEPHNLALQGLGETGIVGFLLLAGSVAFAAVAVRRRVRGDDAALALALCVLAYAVHVLIDVGYDFVAVSAPFFFVLGVLLVGGRAAPGRREPVWAFGIVLLAGTAVLSLAAPYIAQRKVDDAVQTGDPTLAAQAHDWNPVSIVPLQTEAALEEFLRHKRKALQLYRQAVDTQPDNPDTWAELGRFELDGLKDPCSAYRSLNQAYTLDRFNPGVAATHGPLDRARAKVNAGACGSD
jgi:hypothetical protein